MELRSNFNQFDNKLKIRPKSAQKHTNKDSNFKFLKNKRPQSNIKDLMTIASSKISINISKKLIKANYLPLLIKNNFNYIDAVSEIFNGKKINILKSGGDPKLSIYLSKNEKNIKKKDSNVFLNIKKNGNYKNDLMHLNNNRRKAIKIKKEKIFIDCIKKQGEEYKIEEIKLEQKREKVEVKIEEDKKNEIKEEEKKEKEKEEKEEERIEETKDEKRNKIDEEKEEDIIKEVKEEVKEEVKKEVKEEDKIIEKKMKKKKKIL